MDTALSAEEVELYADYELPKNPPKLQNFREQVSVSHQVIGLKYIFCWDLNTWQL